MALIEITRTTSLTAEEAWRRLTLWEAHGKHVPFTKIHREGPTYEGVGTLFIARTGMARLGFDDPMRVTVWEPPTDGGRGFCRIEKEGKVVTGWAEVTVTSSPSGCDVVWREDATLAGPRFLERPSTLVSKILFGRVVSGLLADS
ncbi:SRPBCC family protein [soil metagenome]